MFKLFKKKRKAPKTIYTIAFCDTNELDTQYSSWGTYETKEECILAIKRGWGRSILEVKEEAFSNVAGWLVPKETTEEVEKKINEGIYFMTVKDRLDVVNMNIKKYSKSY